jgi:hypothetical protein
MTSNSAIARELTSRHRHTRESIRHWCARAVTGPSVIRVFEKGTKDDLMPMLLRVPIEQLPMLSDKTAFEAWFEKQLEPVAKTLAKRNGRRKSVQPGIKWGHAAKILAIYVRDVVLHSRYFEDEEVKRLTPWLFVPVDSKVMERLAHLGVQLPFNKIKEIATRDDFYLIQNLLSANCKLGVPRVVFDDVWADRSPVA